MKILMVNNYNYLRGGSERVMFEEMAWLARRGHDVASFSARHPRNLGSPLGSLFPEVPDPSSRSMAGKIAGFASLVVNREVERAFSVALDRFRPDVVHFHNVYGRLTPVVIEVARARRIPSVLTAHDYKLICPSYLRLANGRPCSACSYPWYVPAFYTRCHKGSRLYSALYGVEATVNAWRGAYEGIHAFLCPSRFMQQSLLGGGVRSTRLRLLPNAFPVAADVDAGAPSGNPYLLYAGRLSPEKGVACLIAAMQGVDADLLIAGDGPAAGELRRAVAGTEHASRIRFLGHCEREAMHELLAGALFAVVPSEWYENAPMAVVEAFAAGKAVVGADIGGIPELVRPGETGALFPPGDRVALRETIRRLLASRSELARMGANARRLVEERFSPDVHVSELLRIYEEALK